MSWRRGNAGLDIGAIRLNSVRFANVRRSTAHRAIAGWYFGAKTKQHPACARQRCESLGFAIDLDSHPLEHVGGADASADGAVSMLGDRNTRAAAISAAPVEMLKVPAPSPPVPAVSSTVAAVEVDPARPLAHRARPAGKLVAGFALELERDQKARGQRFGRVAVEHLADRALGLVSAERPRPRARC